MSLFHIKAKRSVDPDNQVVGVSCKFASIEASIDADSFEIASGYAVLMLTIPGLWTFSIRSASRRGLKTGSLKVRIDKEGKVHVYKDHRAEEIVSGTMRRVKGWG